MKVDEYEITKEELDKIILKEEIYENGFWFCFGMITMAAIFGLGVWIFL